ncbi:MAG: M48 family metalloprotease [Tagaea sp.]|nr:M48 family metalloprotease [Tagaea sp.]
MGSVIAISAALWQPPALAQQGQRIQFVRDAETETIIRTYATPIFRTAGLNPDDINVHLINDRSLNAFVALGLNMFFHTGLLLRAEHPGQLIGVIAHETGHISGGHIARLPEGMRDAWTAMIVSLLGAAAAAAAGRGDAAVASVLAGQQIAERNFLRFTRTLEASADQAAVNFLDRTQQSARGFAEFLQILVDQEMMVVDRQDPYVRTHPITRERVDFVQNWVANSRFSAAPVRPEFVEMHRRMRAKLLGFVDPARALVQYRETDPSIEARYARAFAFYRRGDFARAIPLADSLLKDRPDDPWFNETRGQFAFENGDPKGAVPFYEKAVATVPTSALLRLGLAAAQIATADPVLGRAAIEHLEVARGREPENGEVFRQLAVAYGRDNQLGMAALSQAELALIQGQRNAARGLAERAERLLPPGSPHILRAQDIKNATERPTPR